VLPPLLLLLPSVSPLPRALPFLSPPLLRLAALFPLPLLPPFELRPSPSPPLPLFVLPPLLLLLPSVSPLPRAGPFLSPLLQLLAVPLLPLRPAPFPSRLPLHFVLPPLLLPLPSVSPLPRAAPSPAIRRHSFRSVPLPRLAFHHSDCCSASCVPSASLQQIGCQGHCLPSRAQPNPIPLPMLPCIHHPPRLRRNRCHSPHLR